MAREREEQREEMERRKREMLKQPMTAADLAAALEVSMRTVYRDIAALQAMRTPIEGEAGIGYIMRKGYDLPPLNFDQEEAEALFVGLSILFDILLRFVKKRCDFLSRKSFDF